MNRVRLMVLSVSLAAGVVLGLRGHSAGGPAPVQAQINVGGCEPTGGLLGTVSSGAVGGPEGCVSVTREKAFSFEQPESGCPVQSIVITSVLTGGCNAAGTVQIKTSSSASWTTLGTLASDGTFASACADLSDMTHIRVSSISGIESWTASVVCCECCYPAMDVTGVGPCYIVNYIWNGCACVEFGYCDCTGPDCWQVYSSSAACESAHPFVETCPDC